MSYKMQINGTRYFIIFLFLVVVVSHDFLFMSFFFNVFEFIITTVLFWFSWFTIIYTFTYYFCIISIDSKTLCIISTMIEGNFVYSSINGFHTFSILMTICCKLITMFLCWFLRIIFVRYKLWVFNRLSSLISFIWSIT